MVVVIVVLISIIVLNKDVFAWMGYPNSPGAAYTYQSIFSDDGYTRLYTSETPLKLLEGTGTGYGTLGRLQQSEVGGWRLYTIVSGNWSLTQDLDRGTIEGNDVDIFRETNHDIYNQYNELVYDWVGNNYYDGYYISDIAQLFNEGQINSLLEIQKKWEQNLNMQFFIKTYTTDMPNEVQDLAALGNTKSPSGNGTITLYINAKTNGTYRYGLGISTRTGFSLPYGRKEHNKIYWDMKGQLGVSYSFLQIVNFLELEYSNIMYKPQDFSDGLEDIGGWYGFWKSKRDMHDDAAANWVLKNDKLTEVKNGAWGLYDYTVPYDKYYWSQAAWVLLFSNMDEADGYHIWFGDEIVQPTPGPESTPPAGNGVEPTPTVTDSVYATPEPYDGELGINPGQLDIKGKLPTVPLQSALERFGELQQSNTAPILKINLNTLLNASVGTIAPELLNSLPDEETTWIDFSALDTIQFGGYSIIQYFRLLIGAFIIWMTIMAIWKRIVPDKAIGD